MRLIKTLFNFINFFLVTLILSICFTCGYIFALQDNNLMEIPTALQIAKNLNAETGYNIHKWDCSNMTEELIIRLEQQSYKNVIYQRVIYNNTFHTITCYQQCIESTEGIFINPYTNINYTI